MRDGGSGCVSLKKVCCSTAFFHTHLADGGSPHDRFISATGDVLFMVSVGRYLIRNFLLLYEILTMWGQGKRKTSVWSQSNSTNFILLLSTPVCATTGNG